MDVYVASDCNSHRFFVGSINGKTDTYTGSSTLDSSSSNFVGRLSGPQYWMLDSISLRMNQLVDMTRRGWQVAFGDTNCPFYDYASHLNLQENQLWDNPYKPYTTSTESKFSWNTGREVYILSADTEASDEDWWIVTDVSLFGEDGSLNDGASALHNSLRKGSNAAQVLTSFNRELNNMNQDSRNKPSNFEFYVCELVNDLSVTNSAKEFLRDPSRRTLSGCGALCQNIVQFGLTTGKCTKSGTRTTATPCPADVKNCADGTRLSRNPETCEFPECPNNSVATSTLRPPNPVTYEGFADEGPGLCRCGPNRTTPFACQSIVSAGNSCRDFCAGDLHCMAFTTQANGPLEFCLLYYHNTPNCPKGFTSQDASADFRSSSFEGFSTCDYLNPLSISQETFCWSKDSNCLDLEDHDLVISCLKFKVNRLAFHEQQGKQKLNDYDQTAHNLQSQCQKVRTLTETSCSAGLLNVHNFANVVTGLANDFFDIVDNTMQEAQ